MQRRDLYRAACDYRDQFGWRIIPVGNDKKPTVAWGRYIALAPEAEEQNNWFRRKGIQGIAVLNGMASGGLVCRDFDQEGAYERWAADYPDASKDFLTVRTRRGFHVYFWCPEVTRTFKLSDGELRGSGINILPPSTHPSGITYQWHVGPDDVEKLWRVEKAFLDEMGWLPSPGMGGTESHGTETSEETETTETTENTERKEEIVQIVVDAELEVLLHRCLPKAQGERHRQVFNLARELKTVPRFRKIHPRCLEMVVRRWHELALPVIETKAFEESWFDFLNGWPRIRYLKDELSVERVAERAALLEVPEAAKYEQPELRHLVAICRELQKAQGEAPFFLSCRTAAKLINVTPQQANRWLNGLVLDGVLKETDKGVPGG